MLAPMSSASMCAPTQASLIRQPSRSSVRSHSGSLLRSKTFMPQAYEKAGRQLLYRVRPSLGAGRHPCLAGAVTPGVPGADIGNRPWETRTGAPQRTPGANLVRRRLDFVALRLLPAIRCPDRCVREDDPLVGSPRAV